MMYQFELDNQDVILSMDDKEIVLMGDINTFTIIFLKEINRRYDNYMSQAPVETDFKRKLYFIQDLIEFLFNECKALDLNNYLTFKYVTAMAELTKVITKHV